MQSYSTPSATRLGAIMRAATPGAAMLALIALTACDGDTPTGIEIDPPAAPYDLLYESSLVGGASGIRLMVRRFDSGQLAPLFGQEIVGGQPTASSDGSRVVYVGSKAGDGYDVQDLWMVTRGGAPQRIPMSAQAPEYAPSISPDGTRIAFIRADTTLISRLYVADVTGANERLIDLAIYPFMQAFGSPAWSPDGTRLLFSGGAPGALHLFIVRANGQGLTQITDAALSDIDGSWSPDGQSIAFVRTSSPAQSHLMIVDATTGEERSFGYPWRNRQPSWSPDGQRIAFVSNMSDNADFELYTVKADGTQLTRLTDDELRQQSPRWLRRE